MNIISYLIIFHWGPLLRVHTTTQLPLVLQKASQKQPKTTEKHPKTVEFNRLTIKKLGYLKKKHSALSNSRQLAMMPQIKSRNTKKSVSFTVQPSESQDEEIIIPVFVPGYYKSPIVLPLHSLVIIYGMFVHGLMENVLQVMVKGALVLVVAQLNFGYLFARVAFQDKCDKLKKSEKSKKSKEKSSVLLTVLLATFLSVVLSPVMFVGLVLFGAPLYGHLAETFVLGIHLCLLVVQPILISFQLDIDRLYTVAKAPGVFKLIFTNPVLSGSFFGILGTWLGVIPIPLDWDRPWQLWPITLLTGGYLGCFFGSIIGYVCQFF